MQKNHLGRKRRSVLVPTSEFLNSYLSLQSEEIAVCHLVSADQPESMIQLIDQLTERNISIGTFFGRYEIQGIHEAIMLQEYTRIEVIAQEFAESLLLDGIDCLMTPAPDLRHADADWCRIIGDRAIAIAAQHRPFLRHLEWNASGTIRVVHPWIMINRRSEYPKAETIRFHDHILPMAMALRSPNLKLLRAVA